MNGPTDMTPEEHRRRGDAADAMFREMKRKIAAALALAMLALCPASGHARTPPPPPRTSPSPASSATPRWSICRSSIACIGNTGRSHLRSCRGASRLCLLNAGEPPRPANAAIDAARQHRGRAGLVQGVPAPRGSRPAAAGRCRTRRAAQWLTATTACRRAAWQGT